MRAATMTLALLIAITTAAAAADAGAGAGPAEDPVWRIGVGVGAALPGGPGALTDDFSADTSFDAYFTRQLRDGWALRVEFSHDENTCDIDACQGVSGAKIQWTRYSAGAEYGRAFATAVDGHAFVLLGAYDQGRDVEVSLDEAQLVQLSRDSTRFGVAFGAGVDLRLGDDWGLGGDVQFHVVPQGGDRDTVWYVAPTGHFFWTF